MRGDLDRTEQRHATAREQSSTKEGRSSRWNVHSRDTEDLIMPIFAHIFKLLVPGVVCRLAGMSLI